MRHLDGMYEYTYMNSPQSPEAPEPDPLSAYLSLIDAAMLIRQYENRHSPGLGLSMEQRKAWAAEMTLVMKALSAELRRRVPEPYTSSVDHAPWNVQMREGLRPVTYKVQGATRATAPDT